MMGLLRRNEVPQTDGEQAKPFHGGKKWTLFAALGVVGVLVVLLGWVIFKPAPTEPAPYTGPSISIVPDQAAAAGACNVPVPADAAASTVAPADVTWTLSGSMALPQSPSIGPMKTTAGISTCFAQTPSGALLAAANYTVTMNNSTVDKLAAFETLISHGPGYELMRSYFEQLNTASSGEIPSIQQIVAFRMIYFSPSHSEIEIVYRSTSGNAPGYMASIVYVMAWEDDDWKMAPTLDGGAPITRPVTALDPPFILFAGA